MDVMYDGWSYYQGIHFNPIAKSHIIDKQETNKLTTIECESQMFTINNK